MTQITIEVNDDLLQFLREVAKRDKTSIEEAATEIIRTSVSHSGESPFAIQVSGEPEIVEKAIEYLQQLGGLQVERAFGNAGTVTQNVPGEPLNAEALLKLPLEERDRYIARFAPSAEREYRTNPDLTNFEVMDLYEYGDDD